MQNVVQLTFGDRLFQLRIQCSGNFAKLSKCTLIKKVDLLSIFCDRKSELANKNEGRSEECVFIAKS